MGVSGGGETKEKGERGEERGEGERETEKERKRY